MLIVKSLISVASFLFILTGFFIFFNPVVVYADPDFSNCGVNITWSSNDTYVIDQSNNYYCLNQSWYLEGVSAAVLFVSGVQNSTLDCLDYGLDGDNVFGTVGIYLGGNDVINNTVKNCAIASFDVGFVLEGNSNSILINNTVSNSNTGITLSSSSGNRIINSTFSENFAFDFYISADSEAGCNNYLENVTGSQGLPIKYFNSSVNFANETLSELILCNADYSNITNVTIDASTDKKNNMLYLLWTDYSNLTKINSSNNFFGLEIINSSNTYLLNITGNSNLNLGLHTNSDLTRVKNSIFKDNEFFDVLPETIFSWNHEFVNVIGTEDKPIVFFNSSVTIENWYNNASEIILGNADYSVLRNITMNRTGVNNNGIILFSTDNSNLTDITVMNLTCGICMLISSNNKIENLTSHNNEIGVIFGSASNNLIIGGSVSDNAADYQLQFASDNFVSTNFTDSRTIYFSGPISWFNYSNSTTAELWLKTSVSAETMLIRKISSWSQSLMRWNDTNSFGSEIIAKYVITGLSANGHYKVYNNSVLAYTLQAANGELDFTIYLGSEHEIKVEEYTPDQPTEAPGSSGIIKPRNITVNTTRGNANITIPDIAKGATTYINITKTEDMVVEQIVIQVNNSANNIKIIIYKEPGKPASVVHEIVGKVYHYISINKTNIRDVDINKTLIKFKVEKIWINANNINVSTIVLQRYDSTTGWVKLKTTKLSEDSSDIYFQAESPGLSIFAVSGEESAVCTEKWQCTDWETCTNKVQTRVCTDTNNCGTAANKPVGSRSCEVYEPAKDYWLLYIGFIVLILVMVGTIIYLKTKGRTSTGKLP